MSPPSGRPSGTITLSEHESKQRLLALGVPVAPERLASDAEAAGRAALELGFPVAVKLCGRAIAHKTERGLVHLDVKDEAGVRDAARALLAAARPEDGSVGVLVSRMVKGKRELIAGAALDPTFGPCVAFGIGGIFAEALKDVAFRLAPLERVDAEEMIEQIRHSVWLEPFRGEPAVDRARLADVLVGIGRLISEDRTIVSIDVNPLIVSGGVATAVDALIEVRAEAAS
jgi:acetate---CoA ligase (ADP-forming) subunit beta